MSKRYYWLKLKENFFEDETIKLIENMENGKDYVIFLLKLRLKTINTNGYLNFRGIMPYNEKMLATITGTNIDIVRQALKVFEELALLTRLDDGTIYMDQVQTLIGSESESAERVRKHRGKLQELTKEALPCNGSVTKSNTDIEKDIEKEIEIEIDKKESKKNYAPSVNLKEEEYQKLIERFGEDQTADRIERLSLYKRSKGKQYKCDYSTILSWARRDKEQGQTHNKPIEQWTREEREAAGI